MSDSPRSSPAFARHSPSPHGAGTRITIRFNSLADLQTAVSDFLLAHDDTRSLLADVHISVGQQLIRREMETIAALRVALRESRREGNRG